MSLTLKSAAPSRIDPRGPRFGAAITTVVLALVLLTGSPWLLAVQTLVFALGSIVGLSAQPYGVIYRRFVRPRLSPPRELEDAAPPRFAQFVGFLFAAAALVGFALGIGLLTTIAVAFALAAAFLNAAFDFCLGCEIYVLGQRFLSRN